MKQRGSSLALRDWLLPAFRSAGFPWPAGTELDIHVDYAHDRLSLKAWDGNRKLLSVGLIDRADIDSADFVSKFEALKVFMVNAFGGTGCIFVTPMATMRTRTAKSINSGFIHYEDGEVEAGADEYFAARAREQSV